MLGSLLFVLAAAAPASGLEIGDQVEHFTLRTMNPTQSGTKIFATKKLVGDRATEKTTALVLTFGASYCEPCKKELAELKIWAPKISESGAVLAAIVIDKEPEGIELMRALTVDKLALPFAVLSDRFGMVARRYKADTLPMVVVIDPDGKIRWINIGFKEGAIKLMLDQLGIKS